MIIWGYNEDNSKYGLRILFTFLCSATMFPQHFITYRWKTISLKAFSPCHHKTNPRHTDCTRVPHDNSFVLLCGVCLFHVTTVCTPTVLQRLHFAFCSVSDRDDTSALNAHLLTPSSLRATQVFSASLGPGRLDNPALAQPCYLDCHSNSFSPWGPISQTLCQ